MEKSVTQKAEIRKTVLERRKKLSSREREAWDTAVLQNLQILSPEKSGVVYAYISVRGETGTGRIIRRYRDLGCRVAVPKVMGNEIHFFYIRGPQDLEPGTFHIPEPALSCEEADCPDAPILVPGVGFSQDGGRVGYGAGFYDRFLTREPGHETIGMAYDFQIFPRIDLSSGDRRVSKIVTPSGIITCRSTL